MIRRVLRFAPPLVALALIAAALPARAEPLSRKLDLDFFRDVPSRNLKGFATRSDGRLVAGPTLAEFTSPAPADILWTLEPGATPATWLVGTGPEGRIFELTLAADARTFTSREVAKLDDPQVYTLKCFPDGTLIAGTSRGALHFLRDGQVVARVALPADAVYDLLPLPGATPDAPAHVLAATGNPARLYRIDLARFASAGVVAEKTSDPIRLASLGITLFGELRDRNARRLARLADGRIVVGSSPRGNLYTFPDPPPVAPEPAVKPAAPVLLQENQNAEVTDLLPQPNGDLFAALVFTTTTNESRLAPAAPPTKTGSEPPPPIQPERFPGRSALVFFPAGGFPETLVSRNNTAFYRLARRGDLVLISGGEAGELLGYDLTARLSLTFAGSASSQLNALVPLPGAPDRFLALRNNVPGLALLDFAAPGPREAETRRLDLGTPGRLGALRVERLRGLDPARLAVELRVSQGSDELEGWGPWQPVALAPDGAWRAGDLRGRHVRLRIRLSDTPRDPAAAPAPELDRAALFHLPQNRRPLLQEFRVLAPGFAVIPAVDPAPSANVALSQLLNSPKEDDRRRSGFLNSQVVPSPGTRVALWTVSDPDGDALVSTFSIRREGDAAWTELLRDSKESFVQFDTRPLPEGVYLTRLVAAETAPRPAADRLAPVFETDDFTVDHTAPEIIAATAVRTADRLVVTVSGRDALSLLEGVEFVFNNQLRETLEHPADGIRDGREETFVLDLPLARVSNASSVEVTLYDAAGNGSSRRLVW